MEMTQTVSFWIAPNSARIVTIVLVRGHFVRWDHAEDDDVLE
jgi:hypothetical protein